MKGNTVSIKGNITRDCQVRQTSSGNVVATWSIAWNSSRRNDSGGFDNVPHYFDCQCWLTDAQRRFVEPLLKKGNRCAIIDGHLVWQSWEKDGKRMSRVLVNVDDPVSGLMLEGNAAQESAPSDDAIDLYEDSIPF